jgi:hypothetical protein
MKVKVILMRITAFLLGAIITVSVLLAVTGAYLRSTILSQDYYLGIIATPTYLTMVKDAIGEEFSAQSAYVGVPEDVFREGLDDGKLHEMLRNHITYVVNYLDGLAAYQEPEYPVELMQKPLYAYLEKYCAAEGTVPTAAEYAQLDQVAKDSAALIKKQVCLMDLKLVMDMPAFKQGMSLIAKLKSAVGPSILMAFLASVLMAVMNFKAWREWLGRIALAVWLSGIFLLVPMLVLKSTGLTKRLAITTGYLKYFVDTVLTNMNNYFLIWGIVLVLLTTVLLTVLRWVKPVTIKKAEHLHFKGDAREDL